MARVLALAAALLALTAAAQTLRCPRSAGRGNAFCDDGVVLRLPLTASGMDECSGASIPGVTFSRSSSATCTKSDGTVVTLSANQPRVTASWLLVEGAATNALVYSEDFTNAAWIAASSPTVTGNTAVAPDGNTTADTVAPSSTASQIHANASTSSTGTAYTFSVYARRSASSANQMRIRLWDATVGALYTDCLVTPTTSWARYFCTVSSTTSGDVTQGIVYPDVTAGTAAVLLWGAQLETGSVATNYIPTAGTSAARTADIATVPTTNWPTGSASFALTWTPEQASYGSLGYLIDAGGATNGASILVGTTTTRFQVGGTTITGTPPGGAWTPGTSYRFRATVEGTSGALYIDGVSSASGTVGSLTAYTTNANVGSRFDNISLGVGTFKNFCVGRTPGACN